MTAFPTLNSFPTFSVFDIVVFPLILIVESNDPTSIDALLEDVIIPKGADNHNGFSVPAASSKRDWYSRLKVMLYLGWTLGRACCSCIRVLSLFCKSSELFISVEVSAEPSLQLEIISPICTPADSASGSA